ncbi:MAG: hypothetical protein ACKOCX_05170 [Planctomycetota bacterium]
MMTDRDDTGPEFDSLVEVCTADGPDAMLDALAASLARRGRWHALFDLRMLQARQALGLPLAGETGPLDEAARDRLDELSLAACREVGWPLLDVGQVAAAWMYLRAAAAPEDVASRLAALAARVVPPRGTGDELGACGAADADEETARLVQEILGVALWESAAPALGIELVLRTQGTCNAVTAYEQAVSRLPAARQQAAARVLVAHLHAEVLRNLAFDLDQRGIDTAAAAAAEAPLVALLDAAGGLGDDPSIHVDVSHLQSVLRIARVCDDEPTLRQAWELACYACRLPGEVTYPGEPPFEHVGEASRRFFGAQLGIDADAAVAFFRRAAAAADPLEAGTLPADVLVLLLHRLGRDAEALLAAVQRPREGGPSPLQAAGMLPALVELAAASGQWDVLFDACRRHGDEITFAAALAARQNQLAGLSHPRQ